MPRESSRVAAARIPAWVREWTPEIAFLIVTTAAGIWASGRWLDPTGDPGIWWSLAWRLGEGERYYRDLHLQYGPLSPYLLSYAGRVFGLSATSVLLWNWVPAVAAGVLLIRAGRGHLTTLERLALVGMLLAVAIFAPGAARLVFSYCPAAVHALCFSLGAMLLLRARETAGNRWALWAGVLAGLAFCAKQEIGIAALLALLAPAVTRSGGAFAWVGRCLAGFLCIAALGALVVLGSASIESLREENHLWPFATGLAEPWESLFRIAAGVSATDFPKPLLEAARGLIYFASVFGLAGVLLARERRSSRWLPIAGLVAVMSLAAAVEGRPWGRSFQPISLSMIIAFLVALLALFERNRPGREFLVGFGLFAGLAGMRTAFSGDLAGPYSGISHLPTALTWSLFLFCFLPGYLPGGALPAIWNRRVWTLALLVVGWRGALAGIDSLASPSRVAVETFRGRVWVEGERAPFFHLLASNLRSGEKALIIPETHAVDVLYGLDNVSPFLVHMPGWLDRRAEQNLIRRFEEDPPAVVVLFRSAAPHFRVAPFGRGFGVMLSEWITRNYRVVASTETAEVLRRRR